MTEFKTMDAMCKKLSVKEIRARYTPIKIVVEISRTQEKQLIKFCAKLHKEYPFFKTPFDICSMSFPSAWLKKESAGEKKLNV